MKRFSVLLLSLMIFFINPVGATSGKGSEAISPQNLDAVKQETVNSSGENAKKVHQVEDGSVKVQDKTTTPQRND